MCRKQHKRLLCLCACFMTLIACSSRLDLASNAVKFSADSHGAITKTTYGGYSGDYALINWQDGDVIRIFTPGGGSINSSRQTDGFYYADYSLSDISISDHISSGQIAPAGETPEHGLMWGDQDAPATFYGVYPSTLDVSLSGSSLCAEITIPQSQNGTDEISALPLVAEATPADYGDEVALSFLPAFSTFEFTIKSASGEITFDSITLSTEDDPSNLAYVSGTCLYNLEDGSVTYGSPKYRSATVSFSTKPTATETEETTFSLFTLPVDLSRMTITIQYTKDGFPSEKSLALNRNNLPIDFEAGKKIRIYGLALPGGISLYMDPLYVVPLDDISHEINY